IFFVLMRLGVARVATARVFYVWTAVYNLFVVSVFWSFMADIWTPAQGRRLFGFIAAGGSIGAFLAPFTTAMLVGLIGTAHMFLISAVLLEIAAQCATRLGAQARADVRTTPAGGGILDGFWHTVRTPYLRGLFFQTLLYAGTSTFLNLLQQEIVSKEIKDRD